MWERQRQSTKQEFHRWNFNLLAVWASRSWCVFLNGGAGNQINAFEWFQLMDALSVSNGAKRMSEVAER